MSIDELLIKQLVLLNNIMKRYSILVYCNTKGDLSDKVLNEQTIMIYFENKISEETYRNVAAMVTISEKEILEIQDIVPSYRAVLIYFDEQAITSSKLIENLNLTNLMKKMFML